MNSKEIFEFVKVNHTANELINHLSFSHARVSRWSNDNSIWVYFKCSDSPSGVLQAGSFARTSITDALMASRNLRANLGPSRGDIACRNLCGTIGF